ncbi:MAG: Rieske 2Fe-2S domain-containing protein, partial [Cyanobacteria bacterium J06649_11]
MIPNQWYAVIESKKINSKKPLGLRRFGEKIVLWRNEQGEVVCFPDRCSHRGAELSTGKIVNNCIECPYHGLQFDSHGTCRVIPANGKNAPVPPAFNMPYYAVREAHGLIWVWYGKLREEYPPIPWIEKPGMSVQGVFSAELSKEVPLHYSRFIEGSLDIHHIHFVHNSLIPGIGNFVESNEVTLKDDLLEINGKVRQEDRPHTNGVPMKIALRFPNVIYAEFSSKLFGIGIMTPIDDSNCWFFAKYYQSHIKIPVIGQLFISLFSVMNWEVIQKRQDIPQMLGQQPAIPDTRCGYHLFDADKVIALYLKRREELKREGIARAFAA